MELLGAMIVIEPLPGLGKERLAMLPYPLGPITADAQPTFFFWDSARFLDLLEGLAELLLIVPLMPTEHMDAALAIKQIETKALGVTPLPPPPSALGALAPSPRTGFPGTVRPCRHLGAINPQYQPGAAGASGRYGGAALLDLVAWREDIQHCQTLRAVVGHRGHPLTPQASPGEIATQRLRFVLGDFGHQLDGRLVHIELGAPRRQPPCCLKGRHAAAARATLEIGSRNLHRPHQRLHGTRDGSPSLQESITLGTASLLAGGFPTMSVLNYRLSQAAGKLLTQVPHGLGALR